VVGGGGGGCGGGGGGGGGGGWGGGGGGLILKGKRLLPFQTYCFDFPNRGQRKKKRKGIQAMEGDKSQKEKGQGTPHKKKGETGSRRAPTAKTGTSPQSKRKKNQKK